MGRLVGRSVGRWMGGWVGSLKGIKGGGKLKIFVRGATIKVVGFPLPKSLCLAKRAGVLLDDYFGKTFWCCKWNFWYLLVGPTFSSFFFGPS